MSPQIENGFLTSQGDMKLLFRWHSVESAQANLVIVHGFAEHSGRYLHVIQALNDAGINCMAFDLRGHGRSGGRRVYIDAWADYLSDVNAALRLATQRAPDLPVYLLGHSMGGLLVMSRLLERSDDVKGFIATSPALEVIAPVPKWKKAASAILNRVLPFVAVPAELDPSLVSRDPAVVEAYRGDRLVSTTATVRWYSEFTAAQARVKAQAGQITAPCLLMQAGRDGLVHPEAPRKLSAKLGSKDKTYVHLDALYHEVLNEPERDQVIEQICAWLVQRATA